MVQVKAEVVKVENNLVFVRVLQNCEKCSGKNECGELKLTRIFSPSKLFIFENSLSLQTGDCVEIEIPKKELHFSATLAYGLPLLFFILGAFLGDFLGAEKGAILGGFSFLILSFLALKKGAQNLKNPARLGRRVL